MPAAVRRNDPCPCGSGRRFKECHGRLDGSVAQEASAPPAQQVLESALALHQRGDAAGAARQYEDVLRREPRNAIATHYLGVIDWQTGRLADALRRMRESIALDASIPDFFNNLGLVLRDLGQRPEAAAAFEAALRIDPGYGEALNNLGLLHKDAGRHREAIACFERAALSLPHHPEIPSNRGLSLQLLGDIDAALACYRSALSADPGRARRLGEIEALSERKAVDDASGAAGAAARLDADTRLARLTVELLRDGTLGDILVETGPKEEASS